MYICFWTSLPSTRKIYEVLAEETAELCDGGGVARHASSLVSQCVTHAWCRVQLPSLGVEAFRDEWSGQQ